MLTAFENDTREALQEFLQQEINKELLRFTTAGSVDDGKSTLIGRLLHDCKAVYEDQLASVKHSPVNRSGKEIDFSLLTDGLRAEREQGITIDVAYRYFSTPQRKFIIADTPGHEQYTRNMVTGASTADLAIILIDATKGVLAQTRRHAYIASLLGIPHLVGAINKMDLVGYSEAEYARLQAEFIALAEGLGRSSVQCIPISALEGDNVVERSVHTSWYSGPTLLEHLEAVPMRSAVAATELRFPVQMVMRPDSSFRGFAGRIAAGVIRPGDSVMALPSGQRTSVESIVSFDGNLSAASAGQSVVLKLAEEIDLSRGDMLVSPEAGPEVSARFAAILVWLHASALQLNQTYLLKHANRYVRARVVNIRFRVDVNTLTEHQTRELEMNEIGLAEFESAQPLFVDRYGANLTTGSLILIDPLTNATVGAAMVRETVLTPTDDNKSSSRREQLASAAEDIIEARLSRRGHRPAIFSLTWSRRHVEELERALHDRGFEAVIVPHGEIVSAARKPFYTTLLRLGVVVLCWTERPIRLKDRQLFAELADGLCFEFNDSEHTEDVSAALAIADRLRLRLNPEEWKEN